MPSETYRTWTNLFDSTTTPKDKEALLSAFRRDLDSPLPTHFSVSGLGMDIQKMVKSYRDLPERFTLGIVMVGGYTWGRHMRAIAAIAGRDPDAVLMGPTVRMFYPEQKTFADGTVMPRGQLYIPTAHLETLGNNKDNAIVLRDLHPGTGATLGRTVHTLRLMGYDGEMLIQAKLMGGPMTLNDHDRHYNKPYKVSSGAVPLQVVTEHGRLADGFQLRDKTEARV